MPAENQGVPESKPVVDVATVMRGRAPDETALVSSVELKSTGAVVNHVRISGAKDLIEGIGVVDAKMVIGSAQTTVDSGVGCAYNSIACGEKNRDGGEEVASAGTGFAIDVNVRMSGEDNDGRGGKRARRGSGEEGVEFGAANDGSVGGWITRKIECGDAFRRTEE